MKKSTEHFLFLKPAASSCGPVPLSETAKKSAELACNYSALQDFCNCITALSGGRIKSAAGQKSSRQFGRPEIVLSKDLRAQRRFIRSLLLRKYGRQSAKQASTFPPPGTFNPVGRREIASRASAVIPPAVGSHLLTGMEA